MSEETNLAPKPRKQRERGKRGAGCVRQRKGAQKNVWEIRYSLGVDARGKRRTVTTTFRGTESAAHAHLRELLVKLKNGQHVNPSRETVTQFVERWLTAMEPKVTPKTHERYGQLLRGHVAPAIGNMVLQKLKAADLDTLYAQLRKSGRKNGEGLSPGTIRHVHRAMAMALRDAVLWGNIPSNVATPVRMPRVEKPEVEILTPEQVDTVLTRLRGETFYPQVVLALTTGMRRGEILALRWSDIDLTAGMLKVERSLEQTVEKVRVKEPKTRAGRRSISLPAFAITELRAHWKAQQEQRLAAGIGKGGNDTLVFGPLTGELPRPDTLTKQWAKASQELGLNVRFHALRHTFASMMIKAGVDVLSLSRRLGHGKPSLTLDVYCHLFGNDEGKILEALDAAFSSVRKENIPALDR